MVDQKIYIHERGGHMLYYAMVFLIIALIAGVLGFGGIAGTSVGIAKILFFVFLALMLLSVVKGLVSKGSH